MDIYLKHAKQTHPKNSMHCRSVEIKIMPLIANGDKFKIPLAFCKKVQQLDNVPEQGSIKMSYYFGAANFQFPRTYLLSIGTDWNYL